MLKKGGSKESMEVVGSLCQKKTEVYWFGKCPARKRILSGTEEINVPIATPFKTKMTAESLKKLGLFFDELKRIRVWEPEAALKTAELKDESKDFVDKITEFHNTSSDFINLIQDLAKQVEKEKIKALGSSNVLKSMTKQRECEQQQYQSLIMEKSAELERLRAQHQSLLKVQLEQQEMIQQIQLY